MSERNIIKWHYVTEWKTGAVTGLRGWDSRLEDRYELLPTEDPARWKCFVINPGIGDPASLYPPERDWFPSQICCGGILSCMVAAEIVADQRYQKSFETDSDN